MYRYLVCALLLLGAFPAQASCGAAFCPTNTQWNTQGVWTEPGWRADLRAEYVAQTQPRAGQSAVGVGAIPQHHDEVKTYNRNLVATVDYGTAMGWGISASLPLVDRSHAHIHNHMGGTEYESWGFSEVGDLQLLGRYQFRNWNNPYVYGLYFGTKLPTGRFGVKNEEGEAAERSLQPGSGTTDALFGFYGRRNFPDGHSSVFGQVLMQAPLDAREDFRPGKKLSVDVGYRHDIAEHTSLMLQLNGQHKWRDGGAQGEPEDSGGEFISLSPGISYGLTETTQLYGFVQKPIYQNVNGVQLTADWSAVTGISLHF